MTDMSSLPTIKATIDAFGLSTRKALGQHFLLDANIIRRIVAYAGDVSGKTVIEVGPGPGGLTRALLESSAARVVVIEKDERCLPVMQQLKCLAGDRLGIISADALAVDLTQYPAPRAVVANLPYNVGTELLIGWLHQIAESPESYHSLTLMFQKEVAQRVCAGPGTKDYGRISVLAQWLCEVRYDMELPPGAFSPPPSVSSAVITLVPRKHPCFVAQRRSVELVLQAAFGQRRKMLRGALKALCADAEALLIDAGIDPTARAEQLSVMQFGQLITAWEKRITARQ